MREKTEPRRGQVPPPAALTRRDCLGLLGSAGLAATLGAHVDAGPAKPFVPPAETPDPETRRYTDHLKQAVAEMEAGNHPEAVAPLRAALTQDRNEPYGLMVLGVLCLHTGNNQRALAEFRRARVLLPDEPLAECGATLAALALGQKDAAPERLPADVFPFAPTLSLYRRLLTGEAAAVRAETATVGTDESDLLLLSVAAFAALQGGDPTRGALLLNALLSRPEMHPLVEERAPILTFLSAVPVQGGAFASLAPLTYPQPLPGPPLTGRVMLTPPDPLPLSAAIVSYTVEGGEGYAATTNNPPFTTDWNTARFCNGIYTLRTSVFSDSGQEIVRTENSVTLFNRDAPPPRHLAGDARADLHRRLVALLTPYPARKAAHFALAEQAAKHGDSAGTLAHIESVVAIDPLYRNARASLRDYNQAVIGPREGIWCGVTTEKIVALTFDDGPNPARTPRLLDILKNAGVKATFFVVGVRVEESPQLVKRMADEGHEVANHSYSHPNLTYLDRSGVERELCRTCCLIRQATGKRPRFFRPPGGNNNTAVVEAGEMLGMTGAYWTLDGLKFEYPPYAPAALTSYILGRLRPGAVLLMHNAPENTLAALPAIIAGLRARGYKMVTMSELFQRARPGSTKDAKVKPGAVKE